MRNVLRNLKGVLAFGGATVNTILCFVPLMSMALVKFIVPIRRVRVLMTRGTMAIGELWVDVNAHIFAAVNDTKWHVSGLEGLSRDKWYLVISNHQTWVDIVAIQTQLNRRVPFLKFFIKQQLFWFPLLGQAWWAMDMPFMKRYSKTYLARHPEKKGSDLEATRRACAKFSETPTSVFNFVEGTRFTEEKRDKRGAHYRNVLPPRAGGVALAVTSMGEMFDAILDVTAVYPGGKVPKFWEMGCGEFREIVIEIRQRPIEPWMPGGDYTNDREYRRRFHQWLTKIWEEKDRRIDEIRVARTGSSEHTGSQ